MTKANRSMLHSVFRGLTTTLGGIAGISFIFGGGIISVLGNTDRATGEFFGIVIAFALGLLALLAHAAAENFDDEDAGDDQPSSPASA
jgi:hypothetical protein